MKITQLPHGINSFLLLNACEINQEEQNENRSKANVLGGRGGFEVEMKWENGKLTSDSLLSLNVSACKIRYIDQIAELDTEDGKKYSLEDLFLD